MPGVHEDPSRLLLFEAREPSLYNADWTRKGTFSEILNVPSPLMHRARYCLR
jgi:hypothetical protein